MTPPQPAATSQQSRTVLVTFLGSIVRRMGNWMPIAGTVDLLGELGVDSASTRTAVFRLKKRGWLIAETHGSTRGYALSEAALTEFAAGDEVIWHARQPARLSDGWCVVTFSIPEKDRNKRNQLRGNLSTLGFGNLSSATWIAPARMQRSAEHAIAELGLDDYCAVFSGQYVFGQDLRTMLHSSWDLESLASRYRAFIDRFSELADAHRLVDPRAAFVTYVDMIDVWRRLPFRDPGLPSELLPADWPAPAALALFETAVARLEGRAIAHAARHWPRPTT